MVPFILEHQLKAKRSRIENVEDSEALVFETCMRKIRILPWGQVTCDESREAIDNMEGQEAYRFLLEVLTGLESPVFGETEVFSQFKEFWEKTQKENANAQYFAPWARSIIADTKKLRSEFFRDSTASTWGGVVRKQLRPFSEVLIIGNGQLAASVSTAIKGADITYWARREKTELGGRHLNWGHLPAASKGPRALVVAAPITDSELADILQHKGKLFDYVADLREMKGERPAELALVDVDLLSIDAESELNKKRVEEIKAQAHERINELAQESFDALWHRPYGWEDLCG